MHREPSDELYIVQGHLQFLGSFSIILVAKNSLFGSDGEDPVVGDGDFVRVSAQVFQHRFGMSEGPLCIDYPVFLEQGIDQFLVGICPGFKCLHILGPEDFAHRLDGKKEFTFTFSSFPLSFFSQPPSRYDAVQMGMQRQGLSPGVENGNHPCFGSQMLLVIGKAVHRFPCSFKQTVIYSLWKVHCQSVKRVGQGEDQMEVRNG